MEPCKIMSHNVPAQKKDCGVIGTCPFCITDPICSLKNALGLGAGATPAPADSPKLLDPLTAIG